MGSRGWYVSVGGIHARTWKFRIWAAVLSLFALLLCQLPLVGVLGFEFSLFFAIVGSILGADLGSDIVWRSRSRDEERPGSTFFSFWLLSTIATTALLTLPLVIVSLASIWNGSCDWLFGLQCYFLLSMLSAVLAGGLGIVTAFLAGPRRWLQRPLPFIALLLWVLGSVWHFYSAPAVFSYNPFAGYMPGNVYDENIVLGAPFYWARAYHFGLLLTAAGCCSIFLNPVSLGFRTPPYLSWKATGATLLTAALTLTLFWQSGSLGFSITTQDVQDTLAGRFESEHFVIHFAPAPRIRDQITAIADDHEFRRAQLVRDLAVDPPGKIHSYYFANRDQKHSLMGAKNVYMAKPWRQEIYMNFQEFPHPVLRHEIAHVMAADFGAPIFRISAGTFLGLPILFNVGLIEGIAVAADWPDHFNKALTPHQSVKAMTELDMAPRVGSLFSTGFFASSSARSYTVAGSYLRFLLDEFGISKLQNLYQNGGDFWASYGQSQSSITKQWKQVILETALPEGAAKIIQERFRRPALFRRSCPHAIAQRRQELRSSMARGDTAGATRMARSVCSADPGEPRHRLELAATLIQEGSLPEATEIYQALASDKEHLSSSLRALALFGQVDILMHSAQRQRAEETLREILSMPLPDNERRRAQVSLQLLLHRGPAGDALRSIFWPRELGRGTDRILLLGLAAEAAAAEPDFGLTHYLIARQLQGQGDPEASYRAITRALTTSLTPLVEREAARMLAEAAYLAKRPAEVERGAAILVRADQPEVIRLLGFDWYERAYWMRNGSVPVRPLGWEKGKTRIGPPHRATQ